MINTISANIMSNWSRHFVAIYEIVIDMVVYYAFLTNQLITMATKCLDQLLMILALMVFIIL
jgi:hypothetical protein